jgi:hypothetical protein
MAQVLLVLKHLVAVFALEDVVVLVSLFVAFPGKKTTVADSEDPYAFGPPETRIY